MTQPATPSQTAPSLWQSGLTLVAVATLGMALKGIFARLVYQYGVSVDALLIWRFVLAVPLFWLGAVWLGRNREKLRLTRRDWIGCGISGALFFISTLCDFNAIHELGASLSRMVLYLFPAIIIALQALQSHRWPPRLQVAMFVGAWVGIAMLLPGWQGGTVSTAGMLYGLGAATCYALFLTVSQRVMKTLGSVRFNQVSNSVTLVLMAVFLLPGLPVSELALPAPALGWMVVLVVFSTVLPFFLMFEGVHRASAAEAGVVAMFGPVVTVTAAMALFPDERLGTWQWAGMVLVLASIGGGKLLQNARAAARSV
ncbi:DMT family transporter [Marinobacter sp. C2H3]|uniref:DMT family transporter n=1 Tax=Marinobacter sp. C2H3 TaxID=3119003 RepID=UPI00300ED5A7